MKSPVNDKIDKRLNDSLLQLKTGKSYAEWFSFLDRFNSLGLGEKELSKFIHDNFKLRSSLQVAIITAYKEQKRSQAITLPDNGIWIKSQAEIDLPLATLYNLWIDKKLRNSWFPMVSYTIVRDKPKELIQLIWADSISVVNIKFLRIEKTKSLVEIKHINLPDQKMASEMTNYWSKVLQTLQESVTSDHFHSIILDI